MPVTVPEKADVRALPDEVYAAGQPVASELIAQLQQKINHLYEALWDAAILPQTSQTQDGHTHTGAGDGRSIPRVVYSQNFALPIWNSGNSASPNQFAMGTTNSGNIYSKTLALNQHYVRGVFANDATTEAEPGSYQLLASARVRLRPGCKGVVCQLWRGTDYAASVTATWRVRIREAATTTAASLAEYDGVEETISSDENAQWVTMPRTGLDGEQSGDPYLACTATAGERLSASADLDGGTSFDVDVAVKFSAYDAATIVYLYSLVIWEVPFES